MRGRVKPGGRLPRTVSQERTDPSHVERDAAKASRAFHRQHPPAKDRRQSLAAFVGTFYESRLRIPPAGATRDAIEALADPKSLAVEIAHDGQLPHLGIVRLVLKAHEIADLDGNGVTLYLVGNHYSPDMRPDNIHFGMPLQGRAPDAVKHPPKLRIGKANAHRPFRWLPAPTPAELARLRAQVEDFIKNNLGHERRERRRVADEAEARLAVRIREVFSTLDAAANAVDSLGDWLIRVQHDLFQRMLGPQAGRILFLPMADLADVFRGELGAIARGSERVATVKATVSTAQEGAGEEPYQRRPEPSPFWMHCPACARRQRTDWEPGSPIEFRCSACGHAARLQEPDLWRWLMPDIVAYEVGLFSVGIDAWVVGSHAPYHPVIRATNHELFGADPPPTLFLTSVPTFRGLGDPPEGFRKTRLLRALLETEPASLARALSVPWDDDPHIVSDLFVAT